MYKECLEVCHFAIIYKLRALVIVVLTRLPWVTGSALLSVSDAGATAEGLIDDKYCLPACSTTISVEEGCTT